MPDKPAPTKPAEKPKKTGSGFFKRFLLFLLEILLPGILMAALLTYLFSAIGIWTLDRTFALVIFAACLLVFTFVSTATLDSFTSKLQTGLSKAAALRLRLLKLVLGGLIVPSALFVTLNLIPLPAGGTALDFLVKISQAPAKASQATLIADAVRSSGSREVRINGIRLLGAAKSPEALDALLGLVQEDAGLLKDASQYQALAAALAVYGKDAKPGLVTLFNRVDPAQSAAPSSNLYDRYFSQAVAALKTTSITQPLSADQILALEADLQARLALMEQTEQENISGDLTHAFVLDTFLQMSLTQEADLLKLAKTAAANHAFPDGVRGRALLLVGKLGSQTDTNNLIPYLKGDNEELRARALQAMLMLQTNSPLSNQRTPP